jgi:hypothetical protein
MIIQAKGKREGKYPIFNKEYSIFKLENVQNTAHDVGAELCVCPNKNKYSIINTEWSTIT